MQNQLIGKDRLNLVASLGYLQFSLLLYILYSGKKLSHVSKGRLIIYLLNNKLIERLLMGVLDLFVASTMSVLNVLILTALGAFLALEPVGLLGEDARLHVNNVLYINITPFSLATFLALHAA